MRLVTWNVNSLRARLPRTLALLEREQPDFLLLQETKLLESDFPFLDIQAAGYQAVTHGQAPFNGVAILSRSEPDSVTTGFPGDPILDEARVIAATYGDLTVISAYVVNGRDLSDPMYEVKLQWLDALQAWIADAFDPAGNVVIAGDFNVTPDDRDLYDAVLLTGQVHHSEPERERLSAMLDWGFVDLFRIHDDQPGTFTWWDYRGGALHRKLGLRIDLILGTRPLAERCTEVRVDRNERRPTAGEGKPSDHAPVIAEFTDR
ncbi:MAG: exodeoxyribonuclease III [Acidimicrobiia bacterium]